MSDYISRDAVMDALDSCDYLCDKRVEDGATLLFHDALAREIADIPAAKVRHTVKGDWDITHDFDHLPSAMIPLGRVVRCSICGYPENRCQTRFCPYCGADMRGGQNG